jgi:hypothetical protein
MILICLTTVQLRRPLIPCDRERCEECGVEVWVDATVKHDGCLCTACALGQADLIECSPHPDVLATLRRFGMSESEIERVVEFARRVLKGPRPQG